MPVGDESQAGTGKAPISFASTAIDLTFRQSPKPCTVNEGRPN